MPLFNNIIGSLFGRRKKKETQQYQENGVSSAFTPNGTSTAFPLGNQNQLKPKALSSKGSTTKPTDYPLTLVKPDGSVIRFKNQLERDQYEVARIKAGGPGTIRTDVQAKLDQEEALRQQQIQQAIVKGQEGLTNAQNIEGASPNISEVVGAGFAGVAPGLIGGAAAGAAGGALVGGVGAIPGALIGGAAGAVTSFISSAKSNLKAQQAGEFSADRTALTKGMTALSMLITDVNQNPQNAAEDAELFYKTLGMIDQAHARTYKDSQEDLNQWLGNDGTPELARFEVFDNVLRQTYINRFNAALQSPNSANSSLSTSEMMAIQEFMSSEE